jgi:S1-C subfamily serine protease
MSNILMSMRLLFTLPIVVAAAIALMPVVSFFETHGYYLAGNNGDFTGTDNNANYYAVSCNKDTLTNNNNKNNNVVPVTLTNNKTKSSSSSAADMTVQNLSLPTLFDTVKNSVVQVTSKISFIDPNTIINGNPVEGQSTSLGSGFVYDNRGHIVTNNHVIGDDKTKAVDVTFIDGNSYSANVIGRDPYSDLAVLQLDNSALSREYLKPLSLVNSLCLQVGQEIVSIGNPFGLSGSMSHGIISQINRLLPEEDLGFSIPGTIQIDAPINPGNSGGPLLDLNGKVVGITTAIFSDTGSFSGIGFAVPSSTIHKVIPQLIAHGSYRHPFLGISGSPITPEIAEQLGLSEAKGVVITSVTHKSPAELSGIKRGGGTTVYNSFNYESLSGIRPGADVIIGIDGKQVRSMDDIINYVDMSKSVGDTVTLKVLRNGNIHDIAVKLGARPDPSTSNFINNYDLPNNNNGMLP